MALATDSRCPVCRLDFSIAGFTYRNETMYPDKERLVVQPPEEPVDLVGVFISQEAGATQTPLEIVLAEGFDEEDAALALLRCGDDPQEAIALLVAEESEDRSESGSDAATFDRCRQCGGSPHDGTRMDDGRCYCAACWESWEGAVDQESYQEALALALEVSLSESVTSGSRADISLIHGATHMQARQLDVRTSRFHSSGRPRNTNSESAVGASRWRRRKAHASSSDIVCQSGPECAAPRVVVAGRRWGHGSDAGPRDNPIV